MNKQALSLRVFTYVGSVLLLVFVTPTSVAQDDTSGNVSFINEDVAPEEIIAISTFDDEYGGYVREEDGQTVVFRRLLDQRDVSGMNEANAVVVDLIETEETGVITIEEPLVSLSGETLSNRQQLYLNERGKEYIPQGIRAYFIQGYKQYYGLDEDAANAYLQENQSLPIQWETDIERQVGRGTYLLARSSYTFTRYITPRSGVSIIHIDEAVPYSSITDNDFQPYPSLATGFIGNTNNGRISGYVYGFDAEKNGRLIVYIGRTSGSPSSSLNYSGAVIHGFLDALRFTKDTTATVSAYRAGMINWLEPEPNRDEILIGFGYPLSNEELQAWDDSGVTLDDIVFYGSGADDTFR